MNYAKYYLVNCLFFQGSKEDKIKGIFAWLEMALVYWILFY